MPHALEPGQSRKCAFEAIELWFVPGFTGGLSSEKRERFCEHCETCGWLSEGPLGVGEECQIIRAHNLASCRPKSAQAVGELLDPFLRPSLVRGTLGGALAQTLAWDGECEG